MGQADRIAATTPYTHGYYKALSPATIAAAFETRGLRPPALDRPLNYCELGMGFGVSLVANAACFPNIRFFGNDFNPEHVAYARQLASDADLSNVEVFEDSFEQMLARDLPPMDFITMHGIWSWVGPELRRTIVEFVERRLAPGGIVYVSHNVLPGWAPLTPLREAMYFHSVHGVPETADPATRARSVIEFAQSLHASGAPTLQAPEIASHLEGLVAADPAYIAHEYLVPEWHPRYFHQVAAEFGRAGLAYASSAVPERNLTDRPAPGVDPVLHETLQDYRTSALFRRDLYARGTQALTREEHAQALSARRWMLVAPLREVTLAKLAPAMRERLERLPVQPLLEALAQGPLSLNEARQLPALRDAPAAGVLEALANVAEPVMADALSEAARPGVRRFNDVSLARATRDGLNVLLSPRTGLATRWSGASMHLIGLHRGGLADPQAIAPAWLDRLQAAGHVVKRNGVELATTQERLDHLAGRAREYLDGQVPKLAEQGIL